MKSRSGFLFGLQWVFSVALVLVFTLNWVIFRYKNQNVAIKIGHRGDTPEEIAKREVRFAREVAMLSKVQHKNLVKVVFGIKFFNYFCKLFSL